MGSRFVSIWFRYLSTDWFSVRNPRLLHVPFVLKAPSHGRMIVTGANHLAKAQGVHKGMVLADARTIIPGVEVLEDKPELIDKVLKGVAEWSIRFTPIAAVDPPDGVLLEVTGCTHLWGGDEPYINDIISRLKARGYQARAAIADTIGAAWALARFSNEGIIAPGKQVESLLSLPAAALRIEPETNERLNKLGLRQVKDIIAMPRTALRRRFGNVIVSRLSQAIGEEQEFLKPVHLIEPYHERLPCLEPIVTATGIDIALQRMLEALCKRLDREQKGLRVAVFKCFRLDGKIEQVQVETNSPSNNINHLIKLFQIKLPAIEPDLGIELFLLEAPKVEDHIPNQLRLWETRCGLEHLQVAELIDRVAGKVGSNAIQRFLPEEHYWPERSFRPALFLQEQKTTEWKVDRPRPIQLLPQPERIDVTAPVPDYPPMLFRYKGKLHKIKKADGPERIEQEWWMQEGQHRDYYAVEDEVGHRYWLFRSGYYNEDYQWFLHGFFA